MIHHINLPRRARLSLLLLIALLTLGTSSTAQVAIPLPADYSDFAIHPETGDIVALDGQTNSAVLLSRKDLDLGRAKEIGRIKVGLNPISVCYKRYKDTAVFAVACKQLSKIYLIDAKTFELIEQLETSNLGALLISASQNPDDPFIYVSYESRGGKSLGAISLRDMDYHADILRNAYGVYASADGKTLYTRNLGVQALKNQFTDETPQFNQVYRSSSNPVMVIDPHGEYALMGTKLYTAQMQRELAAMPFSPVAITKSQPLFIGVEIAQPRRDQAASVKLMAATYNRYEKAGKQYEFFLPTMPGNVRTPRYVNHYDDASRYGYWARLLPDEKRDSIVFAYRKHLKIVPLDAFNVDKEPAMLARLEGPATILSGEEVTLKIVPADPAIQVEIVDKPADMTLKGQKLTWKPGVSNIGQTRIMATLKFNGIEKTRFFELDVQYPSQDLPFDAGGLYVDEKSSQAVIWQKPKNDRFGRPQEGVSKAASQIAIIDLTTGKTLVQRQLATTFTNCQLIGEHVLVWTVNGQTKIEVLNRKDLKRQGTLNTHTQPTSVFEIGKHIGVRTRNSVEIYKQGSLDRVKIYALDGPLGSTLGNSSNIRREGPTFVPKDGVLVGQLLINEDLQPQWLGRTNGVSMLNATNKFSHSSSLPESDRAMVNTAPNNNNHFDHRNSGLSRLASVRLPGSRGEVLVERRSTTVQDAARNQVTTVELLVSLKSAKTSVMQALTREIAYPTNTMTHTAVSMLGDKAVVLHDGRLYHWKLPEPKDEAQDKGQPLTWSLTQATFTLDKSGKTTLPHSFSGGKAPISYQLQSQYEGVSFDKKTGVVTIDNDKLIASASKELLRRGSSSFERSLQQNKASWDALGDAVLGRPIKGVPVLVRIQISASDQDLDSAVQWYHLLVEVPTKTVQKALAEMQKAAEEARAAQLAARNEQLAELGGNPGFEENPGEEGLTREQQLERRVQRLERSVELLNRQIELLLLELNRQNKPRFKEDKKEIEFDRKEDFDREGRDDAKLNDVLGIEADVIKEVE